MKKIWKSLMLIVVASSLLTCTVFATPTEDELRQDKQEAEDRLESLEGEMTSLMTKINETEIELVEVGQKIIKATEELEVAEEKEVEQYEAMKSRIVAMYENGNDSMLAVIFESGSIAEMLKQAENVQTVHEYDRKQLEEYVRTKETIADLKVSLEEDMKAIEEKQEKYEQDKHDLDVMIGELQNEIDDFEVQIQEAAAAAALASRPSSNTNVSGSGNSESSSSSNSSSNYTPPTGTGGGAAIVNAAYSYLGVPYVWGGESYSGVDCSGLVLEAHKSIGVSLGHSSGAQGSGGKSVSSSEALPGDVVCYSGHVGIYIGNGQMIHAPQPGDVVKIVNVYGSPWYRRYW